MFFKYISLESLTNNKKTYIMIKQALAISSFHGAMIISKLTLKIM